MRWFRDLSTFVKLMTGFGLLGLITAATGWLAIHQLGALQGNADRLYQDQLTALVALSDIQDDIQRLRQDSYMMFAPLEPARVRSISEQTRLLALNATVEAARAGAAGQGFAVVANEVKELAKETARATEDIGRKVEAIQTDTGDAVSAITQIGSVIGQVNDISGTIASAVEEQTATTNEISRNVAEAAKGSAEIARNITGVARAAQETSRGASEGQQAARELARMAAELQALVGQFRYDRTDAGAAPSPVRPSARLREVPRASGRTPAAAGRHGP
jgi:hypothetical protein